MNHITETIIKSVYVGNKARVALHHDKLGYWVAAELNEAPHSVYGTVWINAHKDLDGALQVYDELHSLIMLDALPDHLKADFASVEDWHEALADQKLPQEVTK